MMVGAFRLPLTMVGMIEASQTRRPSIPLTLRSGDTTASSRAFDGYINSVKESTYASSERATITVGVKVAGTVTKTPAA